MAVSQSRAFAWLLFLLTGVAVCVPLIRGPPLMSGLNQPRLRAPRQTLPRDQEQCVIEGNPDFYGLGIRIGIYLQYITAFGANLFHKEGIDGNLTTNTIFLLALLVATLVATVRGNVQTTEIVVLLQLGFGFIFSILSIWGHRTRAPRGDAPIRFPLIGSLFRLSLATSFSAYAVWFWFVGAQEMHDHGGCRDLLFLFGRVEVVGPARIFFQIQSVLVLVGYGLVIGREMVLITAVLTTVSFSAGVVALLLVWFLQPEKPLDRKEHKNRGQLIPWFIALLRNWSRLSWSLAWKNLNGKQSAGSNRPSLEFWLVLFIDIGLLASRTLFQLMCALVFNWFPPPGMPPLLVHPLVRPMLKDSREPYKIVTALQKSSTIWLSPRWKSFRGPMLHWLNGLCIIWTILSVETTLIWNNIVGIYDIRSTGQLIPFIIGVTGLLSLLHSLSVRASAVHTTHVLMDTVEARFRSKALDKRPSLQRQSSNLSSSSQEEVYPFGGGQETVFWKRRPDRRHSFSVIEPKEVICDEPLIKGDDRKISWPDSDDIEFHLRNRHDLSALRWVYGSEGLEKYTACKSQRRFAIVKDFSYRSFKHKKALEKSFKVARGRELVSGFLWGPKSPGRWNRSSDRTPVSSTSSIHSRESVDESAWGSSGESHQSGDKPESWASRVSNSLWRLVVSWADNMGESEKADGNQAVDGTGAGTSESPRRPSTSGGSGNSVYVRRVQITKNVPAPHFRNRRPGHLPRFHPASRIIAESKLALQRGSLSDAIEALISANADFLTEKGAEEAAESVRSIKIAFEEAREIRLRKDSSKRTQHDLIIDVIDGLKSNHPWMKVLEATITAWHTNVDELKRKRRRPVGWGDFAVEDPVARRASWSFGEHEKGHIFSS